MNFNRKFNIDSTVISIVETGKKVPGSVVKNLFSKTRICINDHGYEHASICNRVQVRVPKKHLHDEFNFFIFDFPSSRSSSVISTDFMLSLSYFIKFRISLTLSQFFRKRVQFRVLLK